MQSITLQARVDDDGILRLQVPVDVVNTDVEVVVVVNPLQANGHTSLQQTSTEASQTSSEDTERTESLGWPPGYFEQTYGILRDDPVERPPQGEFEVREVLE